MPGACGKAACKPAGNSFRRARARALYKPNTIGYCRPTIHWQGGWSVAIRTDDHPPPHVHVRAPGGEVKVHLQGDDGDPEVVRIRNVSDREAWRALAIVYEHQERFLAHWRLIHG